MSTTSKRLISAMERQGLDQSALARGIGSTQGAISKIVLGHTTNSRLLPKIATYLGVSLAWLLGMSDDPDEAGATLPARAPTQFVTMLVALPSERALAQMFEALLLAMPPAVPLAEQARLLARRLPIGLSQLRDLLPEQDAAEPKATKEGAEALATHDREPR